MCASTSYSKVTSVLLGCQDGVSRLQNGERLKSPSKQQIVDWVVAANQHIGEDPTMIRRIILGIWSV